MKKKGKKNKSGKLLSVLFKILVSTGVAVTAALLAKKLTSQSLPAETESDEPVQEPQEEKYITLNDANKVVQVTEENAAVEQPPQPEDTAEELAAEINEDVQETKEEIVKEEGKTEEVQPN